MESYESLLEGAYRKLEGRNFPDDYSREIHAINTVLSEVFMREGGLEKELGRAESELRFSGGITEEGVKRRLERIEGITGELIVLNRIHKRVLEESMLALRRLNGLEPEFPEQYTS